MKALLVLVVTVLTFSTATAQSAEELLQQALTLERSQGDYSGAIALYKQVSETAGVERPLAGKALIQMAQAYENLGRSEAARTYQRVLADFGDMPELVAEAREGYARTNKPVAAAREEYLPMSASSLQVPEGMSGWGRAMSPGGRYLGGPQQEPPGVLVLDTGSGESRLFPFKSERSVVVGSVRFSPDESTAAATIWEHDGNRGDQTSRVYTLDLGTGRYTMAWDALAYYQQRKGPEACNDSEVHDWSADGTKLLLLSPWEPVCARKPWVGEDMVLLDLETSAVDVLGDLLRDGEESLYESSCLSEDGRYAFTDIAKDNQWFIRRLDTQTLASEVWRATDDQTWIWACTWNPDKVLYAYRGLAGTTVRVGNPSDLDGRTDPIVMQLPDNVWSEFSSKTGDSPYYSFENRRRDIFVSAFGESGELSGKPQQLEGRSWGSLHWRPTGGELSWFDSQTVVVKNLAKVNQQVIPLPEWPYGSRFQWIDSDLIAYSHRPSDAAQTGGQFYDSVVLDIGQNNAINRLNRSIADSLGVRTPRPIDFNTWIAWSPDRDCVVKVTSPDWTLGDLRCFEPTTFDHVGFIPSPWGGQSLIKGYRPDSSAVLSVMPNDGTAYRELFEEASWVGSSWDSYSWVSPDEVTIGVRGWESLLLVNVRDGAKKLILTGLLKDFKPISLAIGKDGTVVAATGVGKRMMGPSRSTLTILHNVLGGR